MDRFLQMLRRQVSARTAIAGDGAGNVAVPGRANYFYARLGARDGDVVEVHSATVSPAEDDILLIQRETSGSLAQWRVVFWVG